MKKNYVKIVLCVPVFLWIMGASVLFAQEVEDEPKREKDGLHWSLGISAEGGVSLGWNGKAAKPFVFGLGEGTFGYRFAIKNFFIEPYIRGGYPVIWAAGISGGFRI